MGGAGTGAERRRRGEERLRDVGAVNASVTSLGQLGQILESDPTDPSSNQNQAGAGGAAGPAQRRRQRIVRGETGGGLSRRLTVSSREEGRAMGLARGASMRRLNVWDGE